MKERYRPLPGLNIRNVDLYNAVEPFRVLDKDTGRIGIALVKYASYEWLEAMVKFEGDNTEYKGSTFKNMVVL